MCSKTQPDIALQDTANQNIWDLLVCILSRQIQIISYMVPLGTKDEQYSFIQVQKDK